MTTVNTKIKRVFSAIASIVFMGLLVMIVTAVSGSTAYGAAAGGQVWAVTVGNEQILYVDSKESGEQVIEGLKNYYLTEGSNVLDVQFDPEIKVEKVSGSTGGDLVAQGTATTDVDSAVKKLSEGKVEYYVYRTEEGDTLESIAKEKGIASDKLVALNFDEYAEDETIKEGTYLVLYSETPYVNVTTVEEITTTKSIDYDIVYKKTSSLSKGTSKVKTKGVKGSKEVVAQVTKVNGEEVVSEVISSTVIKKATTKVILQGTGSVTAKSGTTYDFVDGDEVIEYAKKFIGNPYKYGGTSLTNGADCSGFVYAIYKHFGIDLPRVGQTSVGKVVSFKNVKKGDILFYSGHVAIYAGNGKAIHAVNEGLGIRITSVNYTGNVIAVRRICSN
jgi:cell wall-associated NlpC family hydrolase/LysM repeat protein